MLQYKPTSEFMNTWEPFLSSSRTPNVPLLQFIYRFYVSIWVYIEGHTVNQTQLHHIFKIIHDARSHLNIKYLA